MNTYFRTLLFLGYVAFFSGCSIDSQYSQEQRTPHRRPPQPWYGEGTPLLQVDSCGCKVYEIERSNCWVYVNNNGGIAVVPK